MIDLHRMRAAFIERFDKAAPRFFWAPGRVNLIGEHTDYNDGYVLPMALNRGTMVAASRRADRKVRAYSFSMAEAAEFDLDGAGAGQTGDWIDYLLGVACVLDKQFGPLSGADLVVQSDIPIGAGLSSSAALELSSGLALASVSGLEIDRLALALAGQEAEHTYAGIKCGIMDQYVAAFARRGNALLIDCRSLQSEQIPLSLDGYQVVVCDSHVKHALAASEYNQRRAQCEQGVELLGKFQPGIRALRDVSVVDFTKHEAILPDQVRSRCRHVVTEIARTVKASDALKRGDLREMGRLMTQSHTSLRDDYQVSCPELDLLVESALAVEGVLGSRMTGGGFGGCTVSLVHSQSTDSFRAAVEEQYDRIFGKTPSIYIFEPADGATERQGEGNAER
jgi:galactokinase